MKNVLANRSTYIDLCELMTSVSGFFLKRYISPRTNIDGTQAEIRLNDYYKGLYGTYQTAEN